MDSSVCVCVHTMTFIFRELRKQSMLRCILHASRGQKRGWDGAGVCK